MFDLPRGAKEWEVAKGGRIGTPADVAAKIVTQLRKDIMSARKSDSRHAPR